MKTAQKITKSDLRYRVMQTGSYFFDSSSMKFFGDTMTNYYVPIDTVNIKTWSGDVYDCYELRRIHPVKHGLNESAYFNSKTFERIFPMRETA